MVRDNGYSADDAFSVSIDGARLCSTTTGAANSCALGALRPGRYTLRVTADQAPDDLGTYEITLSAPNVLVDGAKRVSGSPRQGVSIDHVLTVSP